MHDGELVIPGDVGANLAVNRIPCGAVGRYPCGEDSSHGLVGVKEKEIGVSLLGVCLSVEVGEFLHDDRDASVVQLRGEAATDHGTAHPSP